MLLELGYQMQNIDNAHAIYMQILKGGGQECTSEACFGQLHHQ